MPMSAGYIPFHPNPSKPHYKPPAGAVDAHCHVFGPEAKFPYAPERKYTPCDAPKEKLFALRDFLGFDKNVIVQASCHSKDNRAMVDALETSNDKAKGVAFVGEEVTDAELKAMDRAGVSGVRFNFVRRLVDFTPRDVLEAHRRSDRAARLAHRRLFRDAGPAGSGAVLYLAPDHRRRRPHGRAGRREGRRPSGEPALPAPCSRSTRTSWIKVTCPERMSLAGPPYDDVVPFGRTLVERFPDRVIWGTDWPHPNMKKEAPDDGVLVDYIPKIAPTAALQQALLVDNPMRLYWHDDAP